MKRLGIIFSVELKCGTKLKQQLSLLMGNAVVWRDA